jgi:hypothetical protein
LGTFHPQFTPLTDNGQEWAMRRKGVTMFQKEIKSRGSNTSIDKKKRVLKVVIKDPFNIIPIQKNEVFNLTPNIRRHEEDRQ